MLLFLIHFDMSTNEVHAQLKEFVTYLYNADEDSAGDFDLNVYANVIIHIIVENNIEDFEQLQFKKARKCFKEGRKMTPFDVYTMVDNLDRLGTLKKWTKIISKYCEPRILIDVYDDINTMMGWKKADKKPFSKWICQECGMTQFEHQNTNTICSYCRMKKEKEEDDKN